MLIKTILETTQLNLKTTSYIIDLVRYNEDLITVEIIQNNNSENHQCSVKIIPSILSEFINVLQSYHAKVMINDEYQRKHLSDLDKQKIQNRYLKGVSIKDLALQFEQTTELIEMILRNSEIEIVDNTPPKPVYWKTKYNRKKRKR